MATSIRAPKYVTRIRRLGGHTTTVTVLVREPPTIYPYDDAVVHHSMKGDQFEGTFIGGVYSGFDYETNTTNGTFTVKAGFASIYGRQFELDADYEINMAALSGIKYCVVYVEVNLKNFTRQSAEIKLAYANAGFPDVESDDLIVRKHGGVARMPLYSFVYTANSHSFDFISTKFYTYSPGVAERARSMDSNGVWNGRLVSNLFYYNADRFLKGSHAVYADLAKSIGTTGLYAATSDVMTIRDTNEAYDRNILMITNGSWKIQSTDSSPLNENKTYKFYYSNRDKGNPIRKNARVVGVLISGSLKISHYMWQLFGQKGWANFGGGQYFSLQPALQDLKLFGWTLEQGWRPVSEGQAMYSGNIWHNSRPLYFTSCWFQANHVIAGVEVDEYGYMLADKLQKKVSCGNRDLFGTNRTEAATLKFCGQQTQDPYIEITVADDYRIVCDLTVRLIYMQGEEAYQSVYAYDNWDTQHQYPYLVTKAIPDINPFTSLVPQLEGGQT